MIDYQLRLELISILGISEADDAIIETELAKIQTIAQSRIARTIPELLSPEQLDVVDAMRESGENEIAVVQWIIKQLPNYSVLVRNTILDVATEASNF